MSLRASLFWSYLNQYGIMAIQFGSSIVLARLLLPEEIGVFSVAISFLALAHMIRDFGIGEYLIQQKNLDEEKVKTGFTLSLILSWSLGILTFFAIDPIATFYNQPALREILPLVVVNFFLIPFGAITMALLRREMRFDLIMRVQMTSSIVQPAVSIWLALLGYSYMSLAWGSVAGTLTSVIMSQFYRRERLSFSLSLSNWRLFFGYGSYNTIYNLSTTLGESAPDLIIGKLLNMHLVGIFNRGIGVLNMLNSVMIGGIKPIMLPHFSSTLHNNSNNNKHLTKSFLSITDIFIFFYWPILGYTAIFSNNIIVFLFGENWAEAAPVLSILCIGSIINSVFFFAPELLKVTGNIAQLTFISSSINILRVLAILTGSLIGFKYVAIFFASSFLVDFLFYLIYIKKLITHDIVYGIISIMLKNVFSSVIILSPIYFFSLLVDFGNFALLFSSITMFLLLLLLVAYGMHYQDIRRYFVTK